MTAMMCDGCHEQFDHLPHPPLCAACRALREWHWGDDDHTEQHTGTPGECAIPTCTAPPPRCTVEHGDWTGPHRRIDSCPEPPSPAGPLLDLISMAQDAIDAIQTVDVDATAWEETAHLLVAVTALRKAVQGIEDKMTMHIARHAPKTPTEVAGVGLVRVRAGGSRRNWHTEDLTRDIIAARLTEAGGEIPDPFTAVRWVLDVANIAYFRTGAMKELDLDPDDYSDIVSGRPTVQIQ